MPIKKLKATQQKPKSSGTDSDIVVQADKVQTEKPREAGLFMWVIICGYALVWT